MAAPLAGVTVLDLSRLLPGPYASQVLADLGARVIKVEEPGSGDYLRHMPPMAGEHSAMFLALNRGKESVTLDLRSPAGVAALKRLVKDAHVVLESFRPGVLERLGVGFAALKAVNPGIIFCSISGYGQTGPDAGRAGHDINYAARAGVMAYAQSMSPLPVQVADVAGGSMWAVVQILAALRRREQGGEGALIDVSMTDGTWAMMTMALGGALAAGETMEPGGDLLNGGVACYRMYAAQDGARIAVGALEPKFWGALCGALGCMDLVDAGLDKGDAGRACMAQLEGIFASQPGAHWKTLLASVDCCVEVANPPATAHRDDPQLALRQLTVRVDQPGSGVVELPVTPLKISGYVPPFARPAPGLGEHNAALLDEDGGTP